MTKIMKKHWMKTKMTKMATMKMRTKMMMMKMKMRTKMMMMKTRTTMMMMRTTMRTKRKTYPMWIQN